MSMLTRNPSCSRVNLRVYFRKIFGAEQRLEQNLAHIFGADWSQILIWRRMIQKIHLAQQFGKVLVKQLSIYVLVYLKLWFEKNEKPNFENSVKISDISENRIFFRDNFLGAGFGAALHEFRKIIGAEKLRDSPYPVFHSLRQ